MLQPMTTFLSSKGFLCQPLQGAEHFFHVFLLYFPPLSELLIECKPSVGQTGFFAVIEATPSFPVALVTWDPRATFEDLVSFLTF